MKTLRLEVAPKRKNNFFEKVKKVEEFLFDWKNIYKFYLMKKNLMNNLNTSKTVLKKGN